MSFSENKILANISEFTVFYFYSTQVCSTFYSIGYFRSWHHFLILDNIEKNEKKSKILNTFENVI